MPIQMRSNAVLQTPLPIGGLLRRHASATSALSFDTARPRSTASPQTSSSLNVSLPSVKRSQAPCDQLSPTRPAVPSSRSLLPRVMLFHCLPLGLGRPMTTLFPNHLRLLAHPNGVHGLEAYVTSGQRGQQRKPKRPLTCVALAIPATRPPTLTLPSSLQRAYVILMWFSGCVQAPFAASRRLYPRSATWLPYTTRSLALRQHADANKLDQTLPQWRCRSRPRTVAPPRQTPILHCALTHPPKSGPTGPTTPTRSGPYGSESVFKQLRALTRSVLMTARANSPRCISMTTPAHMR